MKFYVRDEDGLSAEVEELNETSNEDIALSETEIASLKKLALCADKIISIVEQMTEDKDNDDKDDVPLAEDEDEDEDEDDDKDEVVDTSVKKTHDSKKSIGAIEKQKTQVDDSLTDEVADAWAKRFGGKK